MNHMLSPEVQKPLAEFALVVLGSLHLLLGVHRAARSRLGATAALVVEGVAAGLTLACGAGASWALLSYA